MARIEAENPPETQAFLEIGRGDGEKRVFRRIDNTSAAKKQRWAEALTAIRVHAARRCAELGIRNRCPEPVSASTGPANGLNRSNTDLFNQ